MEVNTALSVEEGLSAVLPAVENKIELFSFISSH